MHCSDLLWQKECFTRCPDFLLLDTALHFGEVGGDSEEGQPCLCTWMALKKSHVLPSQPPYNTDCRVVLVNWEEFYSSPCLIVRTAKCNTGGELVEEAFYVSVHSAKLVIFF